MKKDISKHEILEEIIDKLGFDEVKVKEVIGDKKYNEQFKEDLKRAGELGVVNVPLIVYNGEMLNGFLKYDELKSVLFKSKVLS